MIDRNQIGKKLKKELIQEMFSKIDWKKKGIIKAEDFVELLNLEEIDVDWLTDFFASITNQEVTSKYEIIIKKIKKIRQNKNLENDLQTLTDLDW